jgi:histidine triad (HIT) family protein
MFCKIVKGDFNTEFVYEDDQVVAFKDINPEAPVHVLIIPRGHFDTIKEVDNEQLIGRLFTAAKEVGKKLDIKDYRLVINNGEEAGQTVSHLHLHILGGRKMNWPPG